MINVTIRDADTDEVIFYAVTEFMHLEQGEGGTVIRIRREQSSRQPPSKPPVAMKSEQTEQEVFERHTDMHRRVWQAATPNDAIEILREDWSYRPAKPIVGRCLCESCRRVREK